MMQKINLDYSLRELKEFLCLKFEEKLHNTSEYLGDSEITEILSEGVKKYFGVNIENLKITGADKLLWGIFVSRNYRAFANLLGDKKGSSGMYSFDRNLVESEFEKYKEELIIGIWEGIKKLKQGLGEFY